MSEEGMGPLNLSDADTSGFDPLPSETYKAEIFKVTKRTIGDDTEGKLPPGTAGVSVQFKIIGNGDLTEEGEDYEYYNRRVFNNFWLPGEDYDKSKGAKMKGMFVRFLVAIGYEESEVMSGNFDPDFDDMEDRECLVTLGPPNKGYDSNTVRGIKPLGDAVPAGGSGLI